MAPPAPLKSSPQAVVLQVRHTGEVDRATASTRHFALLIGFTHNEAEQLALVAAELASNLVRHAGGGSLQLSSIGTAERRGIAIASEDQGPGITDVELAISDGYSTAGGLGLGLGTVNRLMDELEFHHRSTGGLRIQCQRWVRPPSDRLSSRRLECGAATRPCRRAPENGDALVIRQWEDQALLGVIDGLGHGQKAKSAAQAARQYIEEHFDQPLPNLFQGVGRACRATRGVVMGLGKFDLFRQQVSLAIIGNVEIRLLGSRAPVHVPARRGILGLHRTPPLVSQHPWSQANLLVIHSDGLDSRWEWNKFPELAHEPAALIARRLLGQLGNPEDDATVLVARNAKPC